MSVINLSFVTFNVLLARVPVPQITGTDRNTSSTFRLYLFLYFSTTRKRLRFPHLKAKQYMSMIASEQSETAIITTSICFPLNQTTQTLTSFTRKRIWMMVTSRSCCTWQSTPGRPNLSTRRQGNKATLLQMIRVNKYDETHSSTTARASFGVFLANFLRVVCFLVFFLCV